MASNGIRFLSNFMKTGWLVHKLWMGGLTPRTARWPQKHTFRFRKGRQAKELGIVLTEYIHELVRFLQQAKLSHYRPGQTLRTPGSWGSQNLWQSSHESDKIVSLKHRPPLHDRVDPWYSFLIEAESTPGPWCGRKDLVNARYQKPRRESNPYSSVSTNCATANPVLTTASQ